MALTATADGPPIDALPIARQAGGTPPPLPGSFGTGQVHTTDFTQALYSFLDRLSEAMVTRLYDAPASCLSLFRLLPITARHIVLNLLWLDTDLTVEEVGLWVRESKADRSTSGEQKQLSAALRALSRLHILTKSNAKPPTLTLNPRFKKNFRRALTGGGRQGSFGVSCVDPSGQKDVAFLDSYAEHQWESILHFMVGSKMNAERPSDTVLSLLVRGELMASPTRSLSNLAITSKGFQFLLEDVNTQLWDLLLRYLDEAAQDVVEVLGFLFMLGSLELGRCYSTEGLSDTRLRVLQDLVDYGLAYQPSQDSGLFYPTRLATTLTSSATSLVSSNAQLNNNNNSATASSAKGEGALTQDEGFLVIETNFKVYAYTANPLNIAVLNLFLSLKSRFPNFVTAQITRESIRRGLDNGITANQIVSYLSTRAHPQMRKQSSTLPTTVVDQIRLWEREGQRVQSTEGYLYDDFSSTADYELVRDYARQLDVVLWEAKEARKMVVSGEGHVQVREFIKRRMAGGP